MADIADLQLLPFDEAKPKIVEALKSEDWTHRYWGAMACTAHGQASRRLAPQFPRSLFQWERGSKLASGFPVPGMKKPPLQNKFFVQDPLTEKRIFKPAQRFPRCSGCSVMQNESQSHPQ